MSPWALRTEQSLIASKCWKFKNEVGLYRDDGLARLRASSPIWARFTRTRERGAALGTNLIPLRTKLVTQTKRVPAWPVINQLCFPERHFSANGISLRLSEVQMKFYERSLQALLSSAPRGFAARLRVFARLASLAQIGELAHRLVQCNVLFCLFLKSRARRCRLTFPNERCKTALAKDFRLYLVHEYIRKGDCHFRAHGSTMCLKVVFFFH